MKPIQFADENEAHEAYYANVSPRMMRLDATEAWAEGTQYKHLTSWFDSESDIPLWERAPCIVYPATALAADSNVDLVFGEGRFPAFSTRPAEDEADQDAGLSETASASVDYFLGKHHKNSQFSAHCREALYTAQTQGTAVAIHGVRNGRPFADLTPAKWATPLLPGGKAGLLPDGTVAALEIRYPYIEEYQRKDGKWAKRAMLYRRVIDAETDTTYLPAEADKNGIEPTWIADKEQTFNHNFGFCPVVWYAFMRGCQPVNVIDGKAIHARLQNEIKAHDIARSQWHRGALLSEPQICEFGVEPGYNPTESVSTLGTVSTLKGGAVTPENPINGAYGQSSNKKKGRLKSPGVAWQYLSSDSRVDLLVYPSDSLKAQEDNCRDLRIKLQECLAVVFLDPENIKFASTTSGKALQAIKQKQIDRCDKIRDDVSEKFLLPSITMQMRIAVHVSGTKKERLLVAGFKAASGALSEIKSLSEDWQLPLVTTKWGPYFKADPEEQQKIIAMVQQAIGGKGGTQLIPLRVAVERIAQIFSIENVEALVAELETERVEHEKREDDKMKAEAEAVHGMVNGMEQAANGRGKDTGGDRAGGQGKPPTNGGNRSRGAAAPPA